MYNRVKNLFSEQRQRQESNRKLYRQAMENIELRKSRRETRVRKQRGISAMRAAGYV